MYLKLIRAFFVLLIVFPATLKAQDAYWGVKGGLNIVKITRLPLTGTFKQGFNVGVFANFKISETISFQHEILFSTKGIAVQLPDSLQSFNKGASQFTQTFNYIDLPWMVNYHPNEIFFVSGGIQPSIYAHFTNPKYNPIEYNKDNVNSLDFSLLAGASFIFKNNVGFGARFNLGLTPVFNISETKGKNYVMQFYLTYAMNRK